MAGANLLKALADWDTLAAGLELNNNDASVRLSIPSDIELDVNFDGADDGQEFIDNTGKHALSYFDGAVTKTAVKKFGTASLFIDGGGSDNVFTIKNNLVNFAGGQDFTIEGWIRFVTYQPDQALFTTHSTGGGGADGIFAEVGSSRGLFVFQNSGAILEDNVASMTGLSANTWYYYVFQRSGGGTDNLKFWLGATGSMTLYGQSTFTGEIGDANQPFSFGRYSFANFGNLWNGYFDSTRITSAARYVGTPTVPTAPLTLYSSLSQVATMGVVPLSAGFIFRGVGIPVTELEGSATIQPAINLNGVGWTAPFASYTAMEAFYQANPVVISVPAQALDLRQSHDSDGYQQAEAFISEGPNLDFVSVVCDYASASDLRLGVTQDFGNITGTAAIPAKPDTREGTLVDDGVGTLAVAPANDVRENVPTDATVGNYVPANEDNHALGDSYGSEGTEFTGTKALTPFQLPVEVVLEDSEILVFEGCE